MLPEQAKEMLTNYKPYLGRCRHIEVAVACLQHEAETMSRNLAADYATNSGKQMDGMPRGSTVGNPTERLGIMLASGHVPDDLKALRDRIKGMQDEYVEKSVTVRFVEAWMQGLPMKQKWMIERQIFDMMTYAQMSPLYTAAFGEPCSKDSLRRLSKDALTSVYKMAE